MRFFINLFLRFCLLYAFTAFGWMTLQWNGQYIDSVWQFIVFAFVGEVLLEFIGLLVMLVTLIPTMLASIVTLGLYLLIADGVIYAITLWVVSLVIPDVVVLHGFWPTLLCGILLSFVRLSDSRQKRRTSNN